MRRPVTWLLVGALAALGFVAAFDALRGEPERVAAPAPVPTIAGLTEPTEDAVRALREAEVTGVLTYSDEDCQLHAVSLPDLRPARAPSFEMCRPATATGGLGAVDGDVVWAGLGYGAVQVVLPRGELTRAIHAGLDASQPRDTRFRAVQAASLDESRFVVLADSADERVAAVIEDGRPVFVHAPSSAVLIRPSPRGGYYALFAPGRFVLPYTRDGGSVAPPAGVPEAHAIAWSPDERWTVLAAGESVYLFPSDRSAEETVIRVPLAVRDLDWSVADGSDASSP